LTDSTLRKKKLLRKRLVRRGHAYCLKARKGWSEDLENSGVDFQALAPFAPLESAKSG
jgi:hypothetical protein